MMGMQRKTVVHNAFSSLTNFASACMFGFVAWVFFLPTAGERQGINLIEEKLQTIFMKKLNMPFSYRPAPEWESKEERRRAIYVLSGTQNSLRLKYFTTANLYHEGIGKKVMVLTLPGITEYDQSLRRNLTNDEWSIKQLTNLGIEKEHIEFIGIQEGFFGTLREAKTVRDVIMERGIQKLFLVCSSYHGKRVWLTFSAFLSHLGVEIEIYSADEKVHLGGLFVEYGKLIFYKYLLFPFVVWAQN